jgi:WD40 repeat protein
VIFSSFSPTPSAAKLEIFRVAAQFPNNVTWDLSPDGSRVAYSEYDLHSASVHIREIGRGTMQDIAIEDRVELSSLAWSADGKSLFVTTYSPDGSLLLHVAPDGSYTVLYKAAKEVGSLSPSPDGRSLAFSETVSASNAWLVEGIPR